MSHLLNYFGRSCISLCEGPAFRLNAAYAKIQTYYVTRLKMDGFSARGKATLPAMRTRKTFQVLSQTRGSLSDLSQKLGECPRRPCTGLGVHDTLSPFHYRALSFRFLRQANL